MNAIVSKHLRVDKFPNRFTAAVRLLGVPLSNGKDFFSRSEGEIYDVWEAARDSYLRHSRALRQDDIGNHEALTVLNGAWALIERKYAQEFFKTKPIQFAYPSRRIANARANARNRCRPKACRPPKPVRHCAMSGCGKPLKRHQSRCCSHQCDIDYRRANGLQLGRYKQPIPNP